MGSVRDSLLYMLDVLCTGKVGAIVAGVVLGQISDQNKFIVSAITGLIGLVITVIFVPGALTPAVKTTSISLTRPDFLQVHLQRLPLRM